MEERLQELAKEVEALKFTGALRLDDLARSLDSR